MGGWNGQGIIFQDTIVYDVPLDKWALTSSNSQNSQTEVQNATTVLPRFAHAYASLATSSTSNSSIEQNVMLILGGVNISTDFSDLILIKEI
jgi:hypothetical protein